MTHIRFETPSDAAGIYAVHANSFPTDAEARLVNALRAAGRLSVSIVAIAPNDMIVGHVAFSAVTTSAARGGLGVGLGPIAVAAEYRRRGIAAELVRAGLAACRDAGFQWAAVLGDPRYYGRFGFRPARQFGLTDEFRGGDAFQAMELVPGGLPVGAGLVRYAPEFTLVE